METYIATFFSHFGAVRFGRQLREAGIDCALSASLQSPLRLCQPREIGSACSVRWETVTWSFNLIYK